MTTVITYGTFDLLHTGHINILKRAKEMGDFLIVGVTADKYDRERGKLNVQQSLAERIDNVKQTGLADKIIVEEYVGQKADDIQKYNVDKFVIGSDWIGKFDWLQQYCDVVYLPRTQGVSSTLLRNQKTGILKMGIVGNGRIASRFITESKYVSGIEVSAILGKNADHVKKFADKFQINENFTDLNAFLDVVDAVYIATPHVTHYDYIKQAILHKKHVLCEKPMVLSKNQAQELYDLAKQNDVVLFEAIKTAYAPCFAQLIGVAKSGTIGIIKNVVATFTKIIPDKTLREWDKNLGGGAFNELASYPLLAITKLLGTEPKHIHFTSFLDKDTNVDYMTRADFVFNNAVATATVAIGAKQEGSMVIAGTNGYIYVPAPWWKTEYFEVRFEDASKNMKYFSRFDGDGLRYELADFLALLRTKSMNYKLSGAESIFMADVLEKFNTALRTSENIDIL